MGKYDELVERLNERLGGVETPMMQGDNLAVMLCSFFDNPDQEPGCDDDCGWTADALAGCNEVLEATRAHYAPLATAITTLEAELAAMKARGDRLADSAAAEAILATCNAVMAAVGEDRSTASDRVVRAVEARREYAQRLRSDARQALTEWRDQ